MSSESGAPLGEMDEQEDRALLQRLADGGVVAGWKSVLARVVLSLLDRIESLESAIAKKSEERS